MHEERYNVISGKKLRGASINVSFKFSTRQEIIMFYQPIGIRLTADYLILYLLLATICNVFSSFPVEMK